ncbi:polyprenyl synthetase family protein [Paracoccus sp. 1_MG-2023]|uniref:polyprenyl synthetase family protein n=1 Tax=unclassified Paracoccus (in: a-proteobacteria) TaxID=2688777 RepID=UPI001C090EEC|nr:MULTISPECIES: polyprenyl synthetase family protein [unclassified Paracoccus (in: a-proteobacteria)]MBU2958720.1 polyprenyl synthetase family protein [Paracoccus sp. C2R09]MDO6667713.1 polyprenyl synthetase family protein [Paracoccus sp. 1_MG-2023]
MTPTQQFPLRDIVETRLAEISDPFGAVAPALGNAMEQAALSPGKRFRAVLMLMVAERSGGVCDATVDAACAVELVHAASLIFDDLPCMDDARTRRGLPATHVAHGEGRAVLAGIALITEAMRVLGEARGASPEIRAQLVSAMARAMGPAGLCAGQEMDLHAAKDADGVTREQDLKTGVLFVAGLQMLSVIKGLNATETDQLVAFGRQLGRVFQSYDDLLDVIGDKATIGKDTGRDAAAPGPRRGLMAVGQMGDVAQHYHASRAQLDELMRTRLFRGGEIADLLARVLPYEVRRSA